MGEGGIKRGFTCSSFYFTGCFNKNRQMQIFRVYSLESFFFQKYIKILISRLNIKFFMTLIKQNPSYYQKVFSQNVFKRVAFYSVKLISLHRINFLCIIEFANILQKRIMFCVRLINQRHHLSKSEFLFFPLIFEYFT